MTDFTTRERLNGKYLFIKSLFKQSIKAYTYLIFTFKNKHIKKNANRGLINM